MIASGVATLQVLVIDASGKDREHKQCGWRSGLQRGETLHVDRAASVDFCVRREVANALSGNANARLGGVTPLSASASASAAA